MMDVSELEQRLAAFIRVPVPTPPLPFESRGREKEA